MRVWVGFEGEKMGMGRCLTLGRARSLGPSMESTEPQTKLAQGLQALSI